MGSIRKSRWILMTDAHVMMQRHKESYKVHGIRFKECWRKANRRRLPINKFSFTFSPFLFFYSFLLLASVAVTIFINKPFDLICQRWQRLTHFFSLVTAKPSERSRKTTRKKMKTSSTRKSRTMVDVERIMSHLMKPTGRFQSHCLSFQLKIWWSSDRWKKN